MRVVEKVHQRKQIMVTEADGFIALPGGFGTLDELFEVLTWGQLAIHDRAVGILNVNGFFDGFLTTLDVMVERGFLHRKDRDRVVAADTAAVLVADMDQWRLPRKLKFTVALQLIRGASSLPAAATIKTSMNAHGSSPHWSCRGYCSSATICSRLSIPSVPAVSTISCNCRFLFCRVDRYSCTCGRALRS